MAAVSASRVAHVGDRGLRAGQAGRHAREPFAVHVDEGEPHPRAANCRANSAPMPDPAPVISATRPSRFHVMGR